MTRKRRASRAAAHGRPRLPAQDPDPITPLGASPPTTAPRRGHLFAVRSTKLTHARLIQAAYEDGRTAGAELAYLLDLRERVAHLARPAHPLGRVPQLEPRSVPAAAEPRPRAPQHRDSEKNLHTTSLHPSQELDHAGAS